MPGHSRVLPATAAVLDGVSTLKAMECYHRGLLCIRQGQLEEAVMELLESIFYAPRNANPIVALAEVYLLLSDLPSAVQQYRRAVWVLTARDRARKREVARQAAAAERERFFQRDFPQLMVCSDPNALVDGSSTHDAFASSVPLSQGTSGAAGVDGTTVYIPNTADASVSGDKEKNTAFGNDQGVRLVAVQVRLAGLLDALGLSLFQMNSFVQAHRFCVDALAVLKEVTVALNASQTETPSQGKDPTAGASGPSQVVESTPSSPRSPTLRELVEVDLIPTLELHQCVYLIALHREEEAEFKLEAHHQAHAKHRIQSGGLLVHLYVNRQAFRSARKVLEENTSASIREERVLTIAQHLFNEKYRQYRGKALQKRDLGTIGQCIEVYPSDTELLYARARIFIDRGELKRSVKDLFKCIKESNSTHKEAVNAMTEVLIQIGKDSSATGRDALADDDDADAGGRKSVEEAIMYYSESLKWRADNTSVLLARADCYMRIEDYESALQDYRKILQLNPDDPVARQRIAFLHDIWGRKLYSQGKVREAEAEFTNAIKTDENHALFYYHRALCRFELDEPRYGLRDVLSCQQLKPTDPKLRAFIIRYLGTDETPSTRGAGPVNADGAAMTPTPAVTATASDVQQVSRKRAAAFYGQPSARITKTIREVHDECAARANNRGITEDVVRVAMMADATGAAAKGRGSRQQRTDVPTTTAAAAPPPKGKQWVEERQAGVPPHLTYRDFLASQEGVAVSSPGDVGVPAMLTGSKARLQKRPHVA